VSAGPVSFEQHAIAVECDTVTGETHLTCTCGEMAFGRLTNVLEAWAQWHLRTAVVVSYGVAESSA
jgi:hypothetical protein